MLIKNTYIRVLRGRSFQIRCQNYQKTTPNIDFSSFFQKKKKKKKMLFSPVCMKNFESEIENISVTQKNPFWAP